MVEQENSHVSPVMLDSPASQYINMFIFESANLVTEHDINIKQIESNELSFSEHPLNNMFGEYYSSEIDGLPEDKDSSQEQIPFYSDLSFEDTPTSVWGPGQLDMDAIKIDEVFQVDKEDLIHTPTLAQLNAYDEPLFGSYDCLYPLNKSISEYILPDLNSDVQFNSTNNCLINFPSTSTAVKIEETLSKSSLPPIDEPSNSKSNLEKHATSDITHSAEVQQLKKRKPSISKAKKNIAHKYSDKNSKKVNLKEIPVLDDPEESDSENSSDSSNDRTESDKEVEKCNFLEKKNSRYFWQYNMQAKGPKGPKGVKIKFSEKLSDIPGVADPIFNSQFPTKGIKHCGKARKGDGNDLTPNPKKLYNIGKELEELSSVIDCLTPANELPASARSKSRKEKNKLASRACRLKKKAHHEANKLKLFGLQKEQTNLINCIADVKRIVEKKLERKISKKKSSYMKSEKEMQRKPTSTVTAIKSVMKKRTITKVAGCTPDFVNQILKNVASGDEKGGLDEI